MTYDPVFVAIGATNGDRVAMSSGVSADEDVVVQGALSLYAESKKSQQPETGKGADGPAATPSEATAATSPQPQLNPIAIGVAAVGVLALSGVAVTRLGRRSK